VLFSILLGVAMIAIEEKARLLDPLDVLGKGLSRLSNGVVRLSPWGTFALAAGAAGTLSPAEMLRLGGYISSYTLAIVFLTIVVLPATVSTLTPHRLPSPPASSSPSCPWSAAACSISWSIGACRRRRDDP
jgi:Na+/H+-dicarboxylate symporter